MDTGEPFLGLPISELKHDNELVKDWTRINLDENKILFWKHIYEDPTVTPGFRFKGVEWTSGTVYPPDEQGDRYSTIIEGTAYFDGVRHLYFGETADDSLGYIYYPDIEEIILFLNAVRELEKTYCRED